MPRSAKPSHVTTGLSDDHLNGGLAHPGNSRQLLQLTGKRAHRLLDPHRQFQDRRTELVDALQVQPAQKRVVVTEIPGQRLDQLGGSWDAF
jgi:hypothetical protein